jgi:hypothetical protein
MGRGEHRDEETAAFPVSDLAARLLRRANEPVGMIDVRQAAALHSRSNLSVGRRSELLNDLMARYGLDQGADGVAAPVAAGTALEGPLQRKAAAAQFASPAASVGLPAAAANEVSEVAAKASTLAPKYRVKRPGGGGATFNSATRLQRKAGETPTPTSRRVDVTDPPSSRNVDRPASPIVAERIDGFAAARNLRPAPPPGDAAAAFRGRFEATLGLIKGAAAILPPASPLYL